MAALGSEEQPKASIGKYLKMLQEVANLQRTAITIELDDLIEVALKYSRNILIVIVVSLMRIMMIWHVELLGIQAIT